MGENGDRTRGGISEHLRKKVGMGENGDQLTEEEKLSTPAVQTKRIKRAARVLAEMNSARSSKSFYSFSTAAIWAVQCKECRKWRVIPTEEEYEQIRANFSEDPFTCKRKENVSCNDSADIEFGSRRLWVIDRPNLPKSPAGFKRKLTIRKNLERLDCFYETPTGKNLRTPAEVASFLEEHPEFKDVSPEDFSFRTPKIAKDTIPMAGNW